MKSLKHCYRLWFCRIGLIFYVAYRILEDIILTIKDFGVWLLNNGNK